jgi:lipoprotein-anchoring transpeptidase ErfK/SrfK
MVGTRRSGARIWRVLGGPAMVLACAVTAGCTDGGNGFLWRPASGAPTAGDLAPTPAEPVQLTLSPATGAQNVSPADPVTAQVAGGSLDTVTLTGPQARVVPGDFGPDKKSWHNSEPLAYGKAYTLTASGHGMDGTRQEQTRTFTTVKPKNLTLPRLQANEGTLLDKGTFGVGQPVVVVFDEPITDRAAAQRTLGVTTEPAGIVGGWYWMSKSEVHWRPKEYWPSGTRVTVTAKVYGQNLGGGLYGQEDRTASFAIGSSKIAIADSQTHRMKVYVDGQQVATINGKDVTAGIPISMGKGGTERTASGVVDFTTNSGPHVITTKHEVYRMTSASFGITDPKSPNYYNEAIRKSIRISGDGEFVHLRDWDVYQIGKQNTSHGCINVGEPYIYWFFDTFGSGDVVDVTGTNRKLDVRNGLGDWVLSWDEWLEGSAV